MHDIVWIALLLGLLAVTLGYVRLCDNAWGLTIWPSTSGWRRSPRLAFSSISWPCSCGPSAS